jgi:UDP-glucose 4-epimerase
MKVLVTGGGGYVGRALCRRLLREHDLTVVDNLRFGPGRLDRPDLEGLRLVELDLRDADALAQAVEEIAPEVVIHLAAIHYIPECEQDPELAFSTNVTGTVNLLSVCPPGCRFVFISSAAVYQPSSAPHRETDPTVVQPVDLYGLTKLHGEGYTRYFAGERKFSAAIVRLFNVVGPGETNPHLVPEIVAQIRAGRRTIELGNMTPERDFVHVEDVAEGLDALGTSLDVDPGHAEVFNLGSGKAFSVDTVVKLIAEVSGEPITFKVDPARVRAVDRPCLCADNSKLRAATGWQPARSLRDALADLWADEELPPALVERYAF